jgi:hypothetical protein
VRLVELRAKPIRTPEEAKELVEISQREHRLLRDEGSVWNLDKLLGREVRPPGRLPPGFRGGERDTPNPSEGGPAGGTPSKPDPARIARRLWDAARIVELRALPSRTPEQARELEELTQRETRALRDEGSVLAVDRLLGRRSSVTLGGHRLTGGGAGPVVGAASGPTTGDVPKGAIPMRDSAPRVLLTSASPESSTPREPSTSPSPEGARIDALAQRSPPPLPAPFDRLAPTDFERRTVDRIGDAPPPRSTPTAPAQGVMLDRLGDRDLARLLARVLEQPGVGERVLERALAAIETKRRRDRLREVR